MSLKNAILKSVARATGVRTFSSTASMGNKEMVDLCKEYTMWSWSAQKAVNPIPMAKAEVCSHETFLTPF